MKLYYLTATTYSIGIRVRDTDWGFDPRIPYLSLWTNSYTGFVSLKYSEYLPFANHFGVSR